MKTEPKRKTNKKIQRIVWEQACEHVHHITLTARTPNLLFGGKFLLRFHP